MPRTRTPWRLVLLGTLLVPWLGDAGPSVALAQDGETAQPRRKDTSPRLQPPEVKFAASVEPERAQPGQTVTYRVRADVDPTWHIYAFQETPPEEGPRPTTFDLFQMGGLQPKGTWSASSAPVARPEPAFDNQIFEFHEESVEWSLELKVPADAQPGDRTIQSQVSFQICTDQFCKPATRVSVEPVTLSIEGGTPASKTVADERGDLPEAVFEAETTEATAPPAEAPAIEPAAEVAVESSAPIESPQPAVASAELVSEIAPQDPPVASDAKPTRKDTSARLQPKEVTYETSFTPAEAAPGETVMYEVRVKVAEPWHIYAYNEKDPDEGPKSTQFEVFQPGGLEITGRWEPTTPPVEKPEPAFGGKVFAFHEKEVTWRLPMRVPADSKPGERSVQSQISFMICDPSFCKPPARVTLPPATLKVVEGDGRAVAVAEAPSILTPQPGLVEAQEEPAMAAAPATDSELEASTEEASGAGSGRVQTMAEQKINQGLGNFLLWSALGGLAALVMPCVWPMIPITVNFFVKQGQQRKNGNTMGLALTYCLAIIGIYTLVGVLFSAFFGAAALTNLANNVWLNLGVGLLFVAFGLSLLGLFEFRLPNFLLNASAQGESQGGLVGIMFMALTLTITSFTCTFPVVGALLVMSSRGNYLYPVIGLATFALVLSLPFFVLAAAPGMISKLPKSGDWMNAVKVVGGLIEIGAAFKFLNTAEVSFWGDPEQAWIDSRVMLSVWVVIGLISGLYLLGLFRTDHDHEAARVGPLRMLLGMVFLSFALYLSPALFGYPPKSKIYDRLVVGLLAADSDKLDLERQLAMNLPAAAAGSDQATASRGSGARKATSPDPKVAVREERTFHGVTWGLSYEAALEEAQNQGKPVLVDFTGVNCANCRLMEKTVLPLPPVVERLQQFVTVQLYTDRVPIASISREEKEELAIVNQELEIDLTNQQVMPLYVILTPEGEVVAMEGGYIEPDQFVSFLDGALNKARSVARANTAGATR